MRRYWVWAAFLILLVENVTASYEETKLLASDGSFGDFLGWSVAISGSYAIVGAPYDDNDDKGENSGSAYIFEWIGDVWVEQAKLTASDGYDDDRFGISVAISGDYAIVGAEGDDDNGSYSGSAYIFERTGGVWLQQAKLTGSSNSHSVGRSVAISDDYAIVGAFGSAYIFVQTAGGWVQQVNLWVLEGGNFGCSVAISGDYVIVGAYGDKDKGDYSGSAYIFERTADSWVQQAKLTASDGSAYDRFGESVSISGDYAMVGAYCDDDQGDDSGSAYIFERTADGWVEQAKLIASDGHVDDFFGGSVAISGNYAVVGAPRVDFDSDFGSAYIFMRMGSSWVEQRKFTAKNGRNNDLFGYAVGIDGNMPIVGARRDNDNGSSAGAAYIFEDLNNKPIANAGEDFTVYADWTKKVFVILDGSGSSDEDGDELTYLWTWEIEGMDYEATGVNPEIELPVGEHVITLVVNDGQDDSAPDEVVVTILAMKEMAMDITPQSLNPTSHDRWAKAHFVLPEEYAPEDIDTDTPATLYPMEILSERIHVFVNDEGVTEIEVRFDRSAIEDCLPVGVGHTLELHVLAYMTSGEPFYGTDTIRIVGRPGKQLTGFAAHWLGTNDTPDWNGDYDLDHDSVINLKDFVLMLQHP